MRTHTKIRSTLAALAAAALWASCGGSTGADPYQGVVFASDGTVFGFDSRFLPSTDRTTCNPGGGSAVSNCYTVQVGYASGKPIQFYNLDPTIFWSATVNNPPNCNSSSSPCTVSALQSRNLPDSTCTATGATSASCNCSNGGSCIIPVSVAEKKADNTGGAHVDVFPNSCTPNSSYNPQQDQYPRLSQAPVFDGLPLASTNTSFFALVWPVVATYGVTGVSGMTCNDIKDSRSIGSKNAPGSFGSVRTDAPTSYQMWPVIDPTAYVVPFDTALSTPLAPFGASLGWYKGLQLRYLNGGRVPTRTVPDPADPAKIITSLVVMDAAILNPASGFSSVITQKAVVFPAAPGDDAWSPVVRLHNFALPSGKKLGDYNGICPLGQTCPASYIPAASIQATSFNTIFVVAPPQQ